MPLSKLLLFRLKLSLARLIRGQRRKRVARIATLIGIILVGGGGVTAGMYFLFESVVGLAPDGPMLASFLMAMAFHALLIIAFVFDMAATMNIFFLSSDLSLLMGAPISTVKVFAVKYIDALISTSLIMVVFGIPLIIAFGLATGASAVYYVLLVPIAYVFLSVPVSIGILAGLVISRYVAPRRVREVLAFVGTLMGIGFWLMMQLLKRNLIAGNGVPAATLSSLMHAYLNQPLLRILPSQLAATGLDRLAAGAGLDALRSISFLAAMAACLLLASIVLARRMYLTGWARTGAVVSKPRPSKGRWLPDRFMRFLPKFERAIAGMTFRMYLRDPQQLAPLVSITIIVMLIPFLSGVPKQAYAKSPLTALQSVAALAFIGSLNIGSNITVIDGRCFWMILVAPLSPLRKILSKLVAALMLFLPVVFAISIAFGVMGVVEKIDILKLVIIALTMGSAGASIGVFLGITYGNWEWEIPKKMLHGRGRLILIAILAGFFGSLSFTSAALARSHSQITIGWNLVALAVGASAAVLAIFLGLSARRIRSMEWML